MRCVEEFDQYIPPLWVMCLESVAHLLVLFNFPINILIIIIIVIVIIITIISLSQVMLNFSTNFLIYCSVSAPFKKALTKVGWMMVMSTHMILASRVVPEYLDF